MSNNLIDISEAAQRLGVTIATLRRWDASGKLKPVRTFGNHRRYRLDEIEALVNPVDTVPYRSNAYIYCRVSTKKQQESGDLQRQQERLIQYCKDKRYNVMAIYEEVASGLNDNRRELTKMFRNLSDVDVIVVEYADLLALFGYSYLKEFAKALNVEIETVESVKKLQPNEEMVNDLVNDLVSIVTCFSARLYGARGGRKLKQTIVQTLETLEQERGESNENNDESDSI